MTPRSAEEYRSTAERALNDGNLLAAQDLAQEGLDHAPGDVRLRQLLALALARAGAIDQARLMLTELRDQGGLDTETLGLLGRTYKDYALRSSRPAERRERLTAALQAYQDAFARHADYWTGINVATLARLTGDDELAGGTAAAVRDQCLQSLGNRTDYTANDYWVLATLGEAALVLDDLAEARLWYVRARKSAPHRLGDLASTARQGRLLLTHFGHDPEQIRDWFPRPQIVVFSGHMIDAPDRAEPRFPRNAEGAVASAIYNWLERQHAPVGFASAACGGDILFLEALQAMGGETHVVLPCEPDEFVAASVDVVKDSRWRTRYERVLAGAKRVVIVSEEVAEFEPAYDYANQVLLGLALLRAAELEGEVTGLSVLAADGDGQAGGSASAVARWQRRGVPVFAIAPTRYARGAEPLAPPAPASNAAAEAAKVPILATLFADAVNFSKLRERQTPLFVEHFLGAVARLLIKYRAEVVTRNTWGDGLFMVFQTARAAGLFALDVADEIARTDWTTFGLPADLNLRIALHVGPVQRLYDPITERENFLGAHVNRAARLEPKTPPGQVYASQAFAAVAAAEGIDVFICHYVRLMEWSKKYGSFPTYVVRRPAV
jgi:class 3 adenylate cyclase